MGVSSELYILNLFYLFLTAFANAMLTLYAIQDPADCKLLLLGDSIISQSAEICSADLTCLAYRVLLTCCLAYKVLLT